MTRHFWLLVHRWGGLVMAAFLLIVGLTGSLLAFDDEFQRLLDPQWYATAQPGVAPLPINTLVARAESFVPPGGRILAVRVFEDQVTAIVMPTFDLEALQAAMKARPPGIAFLFKSPDITSFFTTLPFRPFNLYLDPWTGAELGRQEFSSGGVFSNGLMPFIHQLHDKLALGIFGHWLLGVIALLWTIDCFVSYYLTFPPAIKAFWRRWKLAWLVKTDASFYRLNFDLHRANGLWLWPVLFVFAWSSVLLNLKPVYQSVSQLVFKYEPARNLMSEAKYKISGPTALSVSEATSIGLQSAAQEGQKRGMTFGKLCSISNAPNNALYVLSLQSSRDQFLGAKCGTTLTFDSRTGEVISLETPLAITPDRPRGHLVDGWLRALHFATVFGLPYRIFVCAVGLVIAVLSGTGVYIWWVKRRARRQVLSVRSTAAHQPQAPDALETL